jgi:hypothetical protein
MQPHQCQGRVRSKGRTSAQPLVHCASQAIKVARRANLLAGGLLGAHVGRRARHHPRSRHRHAAALARKTRHPEVQDAGHLGRASGRLDEDVRRLQVPVHDAGVVRVTKRAGDLRHQRRQPRGRQWPGLQEPFQGLPLQERHHQIHIRLIAPRVEDGHDVRVVQPARNPGLADEAAYRRLVERQRRVQQLHGDFTLEVALPCDEHHAETASRQDAAQLVAAGNHATCSRICELCHGSDRGTACASSQRGRRGPP